MGFFEGSGFVSVLVLVALVSVAVVSGQNVPSCALKLLPCSPYMNVATPSEMCCSSTRDAIQNDFECLCNLFHNPDFFKTYDINMTQALELPKHCGITSDDRRCPAPAPTLDAPDVPAGTPGNGNGDSGMAWIGMSSLAGLLFLWTSITL